MQIRISEVWNHEGRTETLATVEVAKGDSPRMAVYEWINHYRPDLTLARTIDSHGYHAIAL